ncbi:hypothetical protein, partial [Brachyspira hampsonii]|uniref:hypothetical protein n=1 Tax=Brachyspira hampsonii TaxID=1287055 RepID=UPI001CA5ABD0
ILVYKYAVFSQKAYFVCATPAYGTHSEADSVTKEVGFCEARRAVGKATTIIKKNIKLKNYKY